MPTRLPPRPRPVFLFLAVAVAVACSGAIDPPRAVPTPTGSGPAEGRRPTPAGPSGDPQPPVSDEVGGGGGAGNGAGLDNPGNAGNGDAGPASPGDAAAAPDPLPPSSPPDAAGAPTPALADGGVTAGSGNRAFRHPGVLVNRAQLDFIKEKIAAGAQPWKQAFDRAKSSRAASLTYVPHPVANVVCGAYSNPDVGCTAEKDDMAAANTHALLWYLSGDERHAQKAIEIMNAWSAVLQEHSDLNAPLQAGWVGSVFPRAAEIIRHTYSGWAAADVARFSTMLRNVYLAKVIGGIHSNGNWELSMAEAGLAISVFLDDRASFDKAVNLWRKRVPAYIYLRSDGPTPVPPPTRPTINITTFWYGQTMFLEDGIGQETCRDLGHMQYGLAAIVNLAETALIQGVDLYGEQAQRIAAGLEFHAQFLDGVAPPPWLCGGRLSAFPYGMWEIGFNHFGNRLGLALPHTRNVALKQRPTTLNHHMQWETLTHAELGSVGLP